MKVFLGGTCNNTSWRDKLISKLEIEYFNPVVKDWTPACMAEEIHQREVCDFCLYVITPKMVGVYSIAEVVDDSNKRPHKTLFMWLPEDEGFTFNIHQKNSLDAVSKLVKRNNGTVFISLYEIAEYLNSFKNYEISK